VWLWPLPRWAAQRHTDLLLRLPLPFRLQGLVVPVLRNVETMNYADIEKAIAELGQKVRWFPLSSTSALVP